MVVFERVTFCLGCNMFSSFCKNLIVSNDHTATTGSNNLIAIIAKGTHKTESTSMFTIIPGAQRFSRIFNYDQFILICNMF